LSGLLCGQLQGLLDDIVGGREIFSLKSRHGQELLK
jgi:hypothetical protein